MIFAHVFSSQNSFILTAETTLCGERFAGKSGNVNILADPFFKVLTRKLNNKKDKQNCKLTELKEQMLVEYMNKNKLGWIDLFKKIIKESKRNKLFVEDMTKKHLWKFHFKHRSELIFAFNVHDDGSLIIDGLGLHRGNYNWKLISLSDPKINVMQVDRYPFLCQFSFILFNLALFSLLFTLFFLWKTQRETRRL